MNLIKINNNFKNYIKDIYEQRTEIIINNNDSETIL